MVCRGFIRGRSTNFKRGWLGQLSLYRSNYSNFAEKFSQNNANYTEKEVAMVHLAHFQSPRKNIMYLQIANNKMLPDTVSMLL